MPAAVNRQRRPPPKVEASYTDILSAELQKQDPTAEITYAVSVQNESGRSAGLSNQVQVPSAPTLPPPDHFRAEVKSDGVLLSWDCPAGRGSLDAIDVQSAHLSPRAGKADGDQSQRRQPCRTVRGLQPVSRSPEFLDQTFEWEKHYDYRATVVTVVAEPGKPEVEVEGDDTPSVAVFAHDIFPPAVPTGLQAVFSGVGQAPIRRSGMVARHRSRPRRLQHLPPRSKWTDRQNSTPNR